VHPVLGVVPSPPVAGGAAPMEVDALISKGGKFDSKGKNKGGKKGKPFSKEKGNDVSWNN